MDAQLVLTLAALAVSVLVAISRVTDKSLTLREHLEFKERVSGELAKIDAHISKKVDEKRLDDWCDQVRRDVDDIRSEVRSLAATRPTAGEIQQITKAIEARLDIIQPPK